jgi:hypothetical protein
VSGTSPESLLDRPLVDQTAGDAIAGFYRPRLAAERRDDAPDPFAPSRPDAGELEGYNWGGLTSGSPGRAFWLILLPFTLVNVSPRGRPPQGDDGRLSKFTTWLIWYAARLLAIALTALFVLTAAGVGEDLIGWQCAGVAGRCGKASPGWIFTKVLGTWSGSTRVGGLSPEHLLLLGSLLPVLLLGLLWFTSQRTIDRYELIAPSGTAGDREAAATEDDLEIDATEVGLGSVRMWRNAAQVRRLRAVHLQLGFALILWATMQPSLRLAPGYLSFVDIIAIPFRDARNLAVLVPIAAVVYGVVVLALPSYTGRSRSSTWPIVSRIVWGLLAVTALVEIAGLGFDDGWVSGRYLSPAARLPIGGLPGFAATFIWLFLFVVAALAKLATAVAIAAVRRDRSAPPEPHQPLRPALGGNTTTVLATMGAFLAAVFTAGAYTFAAAWLHTGSLKPGFGEVSYIYKTFNIPEIARDATLAYSYSAGFLLIVLVIVIVRTLWAMRALSNHNGGSLLARAEPHGAAKRAGSAAELRALADRAIAQDYGDVSGDPTRAKSIRRDVFFGQIVDRVPSVIAPLVVAGSIITAAFGLLLLLEHTTATGWVNSLVGHITPSGTVRRPPGFFSPVSLEGAGAYLAVMTMVGMVTVGLAAFRVPATRRSVGILWDIASVWPRSAHPLAAPCYAERAVPDLVTRISWLREQPSSPRVVLAGHSQGTVISAAVIFQLRTFDRRPDGPVLEGLGLLTFGCVLRRLYGRYFPVYFGPERMAELQQILTRGPADPAALPRWRNLWRYTDYLGGQVTAGPAPVVPADPAPPPASDELLTRPPVTGPAPWEWHSPDPALFERAGGSTTYPPPRRHSDFWKDDSGYFQLAVTDLGNQIAE